MCDAITLYHGSYEIVASPQYGKGRASNDYGQGFYCTQSLELAKEWACTNAQQSGFANEYEFDMHNLKVLKLNEQHSSLNWLALLVSNRTITLRTPTMKEAASWLISNYTLDIKTYDAIIGYRADDSYFAFARAFLSNQISLGQLETAMRLGNLGEQFVLKSRRAFKRIRFTQCHEVLASEYYPRRNMRNIEAQTAFEELLQSGFDKESPYITDLMRS